MRFFLASAKGSRECLLCRQYRRGWVLSARNSLPRVLIPNSTATHFADLGYITGIKLNRRFRINITNFPSLCLSMAMSSLPNIISITVACFAIWILWKAYRKSRLSPLDNIAGPPSGSFLKGKFQAFWFRTFQLIDRMQAISLSSLTITQGSIK